MQTMGAMAIVGNITLFVILFRYKHMAKASFVLIANMAVADVLHGVVTTTYFYPPIVLKDVRIVMFALENELMQVPQPVLMRRFTNLVDWTAWGITIT